MSKNNMVKSEDTHVRKTNYPGMARRYLPEVRVSFHTTDKCYQAVGRKLVRGEALDPTYQLISVTTNKTLSAPAGSFTITLAGDQWEDRLTSNDLVVISMGYVGEAEMKTVMVGLIDRVRTRRSAQGGKPIVQTTVSGRDFGKMLIKTQLKFYPEIGETTKNEAEKFFLTDVGAINMLKIFTDDDMVEGTPAIILKKIIAEIFLKLNNTEWSVYDESKSEPSVKKVGVGNVIAWIFEDTDFFLPFMLTADQFEGSIWNLMERATQKPFTELFIDTRDNEEGFASNGGAGIVVRTVGEANNKKSKVQTTVTEKKPPVDKFHTVVRGDTLWALAGRYYKKNTDWRKIWEANKAMMIARDKRNEYMHGHWIYPGQKLKIPGIQESDGTTTTTKTVTEEKFDTDYPPNTMKFGTDMAQVILTYRTTPFDTKDRKKLVTHDLYAEDVIEETLERSDDEHFNLFWAGTIINPLGDLNLKRVVPPLMNEADVKRYGISPLEVEIEGLSINRDKEDETKIALENLTGKYTGILKAWYENNHKYYNGTLSVRGYGGYRIGQRLIYEDIGKEFYIEGVNQNFHVYQDWTTTLTVTRGMETDEKVNSEDFIRKSEPPKKEDPAPKKEPPKDDYYTVKKGDTLWAISIRYYGKGIEWRRIWEANKDMLIKRDKRNASNHGHWIYPGQKLRIPKK